MVVALLLVLAGCGRGAGVGAPAGDATDPGWPATVEAPASEPPMLPNDHGVGRAQLLYRHYGQHWIARIADGREYTLPAEADVVSSREDGTTFGGTLSPDGRWLVLHDTGPNHGRDGWQYRDLLGTTTHDFGEPLAWSTDGHWVVSRNRGGNYLTERMDLTTGAITPVAGPGAPAGILPNGDVVLVRPDENPFSLPSISPRPSPAADARAGGLTFAVVRPGAGQQRAVRAAVDEVLSDEQRRIEYTGWSQWAVSGDGTELAAFGGSEVAPRRFAVRFSLADGHLLGTLPIRSAGGTSEPYQLLGGYTADGAVLFNEYRGADGVDLLRYPRDGGAPRTLCHVAADYQFSWRTSPNGY